MMELTRLLDVFVDGWNAGSGTALAEAFAPNADFTNIMGLRAHGRDMIARGHDEILATVFRGTRLGAATDQVRLVRPDVAVVDATFSLCMANGEALAGPARSHVTFVAANEAGAWSIVSFHNMIPFARPAAGPLEESLART